MSSWPQKLYKMRFSLRKKYSLLESLPRKMFRLAVVVRPNLSFSCLSFDFSLLGFSSNQSTFQNLTLLNSGLLPGPRRRRGRPLLRLLRPQPGLLRLQSWLRRPRRPRRSRRPRRICWLRRLRWIWWIRCEDCRCPPALRLRCLRSLRR